MLWSCNRLLIGWNHSNPQNSGYATDRLKNSFNAYAGIVGAREVYDKLRNAISKGQQNAQTQIEIK